MENIVVSIVCNTYNHEEYIRDALDGFVMQKADFAFEILVHDDASTDNTAQIIREYEAKYPELIKPIYQTVNQYSQGIGISRTYQYPRAKGKYIAICEGDDYWTDPDKLQKQVEALEAHPEVDICAHSVSMVMANTGKSIRVIAPAAADTIIPVEQVIMGGGGFVATNSLMFRTELNKNIPQFRQKLDLDYLLQIHGSLRGGMLYLKDNMAYYRYMVSGSWTQRVASVKEKHIHFQQKLVDMLRQLDEDTEYAYKNIINYTCLRREFAVLELCENYSAMRREPYLKVYCQLSVKRKVTIFVKERFPWMVRLLKRKMKTEK